MSESIEPGLSQLLSRANRLIREQALSQSRAKGAAGVRPAHAALFPHIPAEGVRVGVLAQQAGLSKQAVSQLLDDLSREGLVSTSPDPGDRRASLVAFTKRGLEALRGGMDVNAAVDEELAKRLGEARTERLRADLTALIEAIRG